MTIAIGRDGPKPGSASVRPRRLKESTFLADYTDKDFTRPPSCGNGLGDHLIGLCSSTPRSQLGRAPAPGADRSDPAMPPSSSPATASPARHRSGRAALGSEGGLTLIEVLVTALIVMLLASATATGADLDCPRQWRPTDPIAGRRARQPGSAAAARALRRAAQRAQPKSHPDRGRQGLHGQVGGELPGHAGGSSCTSQAAASYKITSTVSWTEGFSSRTDTSVTEESLLARPVTGDLLAQVNDQTHQPLPGVTVVASGPSTQTATTDSNGCVLFAGLKPGGYVATLTDLGYVDPNGKARPQQHRDGHRRRASPTLRGTRSRWGWPARSQAPSPRRRRGRRGGRRHFMAGERRARRDERISVRPRSRAPMTSLTTGLLFPFDLAKSGAGVYTNNYAAWAGRCGQQQPPSPPTATPSSPGPSARPQNVQEPLLALTSVTFTSAAGVQRWSSRTT